MSSATSPHPSHLHWLSTLPASFNASAIAAQQLTPIASTGAECTVTLAPTPSSSCRIRWVLNLNALSPLSHTRSMRVPSWDNGAQLASTALVDDSNDAVDASRSGLILGGRLDGLNDEPEEHDCLRAQQCGASYDACEGVTSSSSEQRLRWCVEVRRSSVAPDWQQRAAQV